MSPYPFILILGQDDNERIMGEQLRELGHRRAVEYRARRARRRKRTTSSRRSSSPTARIREIAAAWVAGCDGARSAVRELNGIAFPGAPYEHVFFVADTRDDRARWCRTRSTSISGARASTCSSRCAGRTTGASSASCRRSCAAETDLTFDDVMPSIRAGGGSRAVVPGLQLVLHLPHPSPPRRALPRPPLLPAGRRGAHPQPGRRAGHEHRPAGRLQPGVEARAGASRASADADAARLLRGGAHPGRAAPAEHDRPRVQAGRVRQLARRTVPHADPGQNRWRSR